MSDNTRELSNKYRIAHLFADYGVEAEVLQSIGEVHRYTIDPVSSPFVAKTVKMNLMEDCPNEQYDLAVFHPKCAKWSDMPNVNSEDHENQIPRTRELAERMADDYIIENKPKAPLINPTVLNGRMFGLPLDYKRAFETSFEVSQPPRQKSFAGKTVSPYFYSDRTTEWWMNVKGYVGDYPKQHIAKNAVPSAYMQFLTRSWLESKDTRDTNEVQDNRGPPPRDNTHQNKLTNCGAENK